MSEQEVLARLPRVISHFLGYRPKSPKPLPQYLIYLWSFINTFIALCVLQAIFRYSHYFINRGVPGIIASYVRAFLTFPFLTSLLPTPFINIIH